MANGVGNGIQKGRNFADKVANSKAVGISKEVLSTGKEFYGDFMAIAGDIQGVKQAFAAFNSSSSDQGSSQQKDTQTDDKLDRRLRMFNKDSQNDLRKKLRKVNGVSRSSSHLR